MSIDVSTPVEKRIDVACSPEHAFRVFTERMTDWWPLDTHSLYQGRPSTCHVEPRAGGEVYEMSEDGERGHWADVVAWEPPARLVLAWKVNADDPAATEIEVRFDGDPDGPTRVTLVHRNWEALGADADAARSSYDEGWDLVLDRFGEAAAR
jgi:uncharacterized protein YndB with AHSA1/START domain